MKIRHKQSGVVLEGQFCECSNGGTGIPTRHYFSDVESGSLYDMAVWETVKPKSRYEGWLYEHIVKDLSDRMDIIEQRQS